MITRPRLEALAPGALPTVMVLVIVVTVGARLIYLSVQHHTAIAREAAAAACAEFAAKIEPGLTALAAQATRQAALAAETRPAPGPTLDSPALAEHTFWMGLDDTVVRAPADAKYLAEGIASEFKSAESARPLPATAMLGPMRIGSQWIVAARAPAASGGGANRPGFAASSVAYSDLDDLIADSRLAHLVDLGYDFQLSQVLPRGLHPRIFAGSTLEPLADAVSTHVRQPVAVIPGSYLELAVKPHAGWYPVSLLVADVGLIAFLAWLLAFGTHDLSHAVQRSRSALSAARRRLHTLQQQLDAERQQRTNLQETFSHALFHDAFTGLPNRRYFMDRLDRALRDVRAKQRPRLAVAIMDITRFKLVNDLLGHTAGDELMVQVARRLEKSAAGTEWVLARWGGDQFALLMLKLDSATEALNVGALLREQLRVPFQLRRHQLAVAASVGVTCTDSGEQRAEEVVREADIALSVAKRTEGPKIVLYAPNMGGQAATLVGLEADLHIALEKRQLQLLLQPIVDLGTCRMVGAEALLRWRHPVEGVLAPDRFLRIAEDAGLMVPITRWVILRALKIVANWRRRLPAGHPFFISINLSPTTLRDPELAGYVGTLLRETNLPAGFIKFEVNESALASNVAAARETLEQLHALGVGLMLDDFGTGFSSLSNLQLFPFDFVKIERPFVNLNDADQANTGMIAAMLQITASLKLTPIAEAIESQAAATALEKMGCGYGQGYHFSEPIEAEMALRRLSSQEPFRPREAPGTVETAAASPATQIVAPVLDSSPTLVIAPIDDLSPALIFAPLADSSSPAIHTPADDSAATMAKALEELWPMDASQTSILPPLAADATLEIALPAAENRLQGAMAAMNHPADTDKDTASVARDRAAW
jgi:diguanylate cyclase (GGDEF)-like protein